MSGTSNGDRRVRESAAPPVDAVLGAEQRRLNEARAGSVAWRRWGPGSSFLRKVRSLVGLMPMLAVETLEPDLLEALPEFKRRMDWFLRNRPELASLVASWEDPGVGQRRLLALVHGHRMKALLGRMLDPDEFLSDHGIRSVSAVHGDHPFVLSLAGEDHVVDYEPAESQTGTFGGNSNWRGPIWWPINYLLIDALQKFDHHYGMDFRVPLPTGSDPLASIGEVADRHGHPAHSTIIAKAKHMPRTSGS